MGTFSAIRSNVSRQRAAGLVGQLKPVAMPLTGSGAVEAVPGWLYCNGAVLSRTTYKRLFDLIGTAFNTGGEAGTDFRLPDWRGRYMAAPTDGATVTVIAGLTRGAVVGAETVVLTKANIEKHTHGVGTYNVTSSGAHLHAIGSVAINNEGGGGVRGSRNATRNADDPTTKGVGGSVANATHSHTVDGSNTGNGVADGLNDADTGAAHDNLHPHQGCGGWLVRY